MSNKSEQRAEMQASVDGIGLIEFVKKTEQDSFRDEFNSFVEGDLFIGSGRETHPRFATIHAGPKQTVILPDEYDSELFDEVTVSVVSETNDLSTITLYAKINKEAFRQQRKQRQESGADYLNLSHFGKYTLEDAEEQLGEFLCSEATSGFFANRRDQFVAEYGNLLTQPSVWFYDLQEFSFKSPAEFWEKNKSKRFLYGLGIDESDAQQYTPFANARCLVNGAGTRYFQTTLGHFPFRFNIVRLEQEELPEHPFEFNPQEQEHDRLLEFGQGVGPLTRAYARLFWALGVYYDLNQYTPRSILDPTDDVSEHLRSQTDTEKYRQMNELRESRQNLAEFWERQRRQMESIKSAVRYHADQGSYETKNDTVIAPLTDTALDIENLCEERVDQLQDRHRSMVDWIESSLEANVNIAVKKLTIVVLAFTAMNVAIAFGGLLVQFTVSLGNALASAILFGTAFFGIVYALAERWA